MPITKKLAGILGLIIGLRVNKMTKRIIKFRAWDKEMRCWGYGDFKNGLSVFFATNELNWDTLGQFTSLHDKNGVEIYEGDIIKWDEGVANHPWIIGPVKLVSGDVGPCHGPNVFQWVIGDTYNLWELEYMEVIGNIYESPNLLLKKL